MSDSPPASGPQTPFAVHLLIYVLLAALFGCVLVSRCARPLVVSDPAAFDPALAAAVEQRVDPNTASWAELARLPGLGEVLAKRIVEFRQQRLARRPARPVFRNVSDLEAVSGLGPKKLAAVRPFLKFPDMPADDR